MPYPVTTLNCIKCTAPLFRKEEIIVKNNVVITQMKAKLAITVSRNNIVKCGVCKEIVGAFSKENNTCVISKTKSFEFTYRKL